MSGAFEEKYQRAMASELLAPDMSESGWLQERLLPPGLPETAARNKVREQLAIYRNNVMYSLTQAMADQFPVIKKVVGDRFFLALASDYILSSPPQQPTLTYIGDTFPAFIGNNDHCRQLPYLQDLAKLEWLCQKALHAADDPVLESQELGKPNLEKLPDGIFRLHDSVSLLSSPYPVFRIWEENLGDEPRTIDLANACPTFALVYRSQFNVQVINLEEPVFDLLYFLKQGKALGDAWSSVSAQHGLSDSELPRVLAWLLGQGIFSEIKFKE